MIFRVAVAVLFVGALTAYDLEHIVEARGAPNQVCYQHPLDIAFVLDASSSIWGQNFTKAKQFVNSFINPYEFGPSKVRVALETYGHEVFTQDIIYFGNFSDKGALQKHIAGLKWHAGHRTETGLGLAYMRDVIMQEARPSVPHICIVITDGESQEPEKTALEAVKARKDGIDIFAIGVSDAVNKEELKAIAGSLDRVIIVKTYSELEAIKDKLSGQTCKNVPTPPPTRPADACGLDKPTDIYYVFDPASLGLSLTNWVTTFIRHTLDFEQFEHIKYGVISGSCPIDRGFWLNQYSSFRQITSHLERYDSSRLSTLITIAYRNGFKKINGGGSPRKVIVIFIGGKVDAKQVVIEAGAAKAENINVFFAGAELADPRLKSALEEIGFPLYKSGESARRQAEAFVQQLCPYRRN